MTDTITPDLELDTDVEFRPITVDIDSLFEGRSKLIMQRANSTRKDTNTLRKKLVPLIDRLSQASVPDGVDVRVSLSIDGHVYITLSNLDSFHDATEVMAVCREYIGSYWRDEEPTVSDDIASRSRRISYFGWYKYQSIVLKLIIGEEAKGCKIVERTRLVEVPAPRAYTKEHKTVIEFVCPGDPDYDMVD